MEFIISNLCVFYNFIYLKNKYKDKIIICGLRIDFINSLNKRMVKVNLLCYINTRKVALDLRDIRYVFILVFLECWRKESAL